MIKKILDQTEENMVKKGMSDEQIELALKYSAKFMQPLWMAIMSIVMYTFWGTIISLIVGIFTKKEDPSFEGQFK
jgi:hypothetical protein